MHLADPAVYASWIRFFIADALHGENHERFFPSKASP